MDPNCNHKAKWFLGPRACSHGISYGIFPKDFGQIVLLSSPLPPRCHIFLAIETWPGQPKIPGLRLQPWVAPTATTRTRTTRTDLGCADGVFMFVLGFTTLIYIDSIRFMNPNWKVVSSHQPRQPSWINHQPVGSQCWGRPPTSSVWLVSVTCLYPTYLSNLSLSIVYLYQTNLYPACLYQILSQT